MSLACQPDAAARWIFIQGHEVVAPARSRHAGGIKVGNGDKHFEQVYQSSLDPTKAGESPFDVVIQIAVAPKTT